MYPEKIRPENNAAPADEETIEAIVELTDRNRKNRTNVLGVISLLASSLSLSPILNLAVKAQGQN